MISKSTIDQIYETMRIEEVIGDFVHLKRAGSNYKALSPFTNEKTPSFYVSPAKQIFKCFSSGIGGNAVTFLMEYEKMTYHEALRYIANKYGIPIEERELTTEEISQKTREESLYIVNDWARRWFEEQLWQTEEGRAVGLAYFRERSFTDATIRKFQLGYSPANPQALLNAANQAGHNLEYLLELGLVKRSEKGELYDAFRERVIFPIVDRAGRVAGFAGRIMNSQAKAAKYINSPESPIYNKSKILYGLYHARKSIAKADMCFLAEGYTDVISLYQAGIENVVASSGTSLTEGQIRLIRQLTGRVAILFDGDPAGIKASQRGIDMFLREDFDVRVLLFPEGHDPDSFARQHSSSVVQEYISENLQDFIRFKAQFLATGPEATPTQKVQAARELLESIAHLRGELKQSIYLRDAAQILGIDQTILSTELRTIQARLQKELLKDEQNRQRTTAPKLQVVENPKSEPRNSKLYYIERQLLWLLVNFANREDNFTNPFDHSQKFSARIGELIYDSLLEDQLAFTHPEHNVLADMIFKYFRNHNKFPESQDFIRHQSIDSLYAELSSITYKISPNWENKGIYVTDFNQLLEIDTIETILRFKDQHLALNIGELTNALSQTEDESQRLQINRLILNKIQLRQKLNNLLRRVVG
ncbi:DNA primase [Schleiferia thermophila]|jgi:DNA primase|uniref:DNA primase n=1 Tax=Schleiferia thermophila TaxID=884107 RepID=UPI0004E640A9|nr:DNA primase [Schleiferia thermophila]KFD38337.1 hypothetical protein AT05_10745 [Schleiferia thermophila str. Yellowstone]